MDNKITAPVYVLASAMKELYHFMKLSIHCPEDGNSCSKCHIQNCSLCYYGQAFEDLIEEVEKLT